MNNFGRGSYFKFTFLPSSAFYAYTKNKQLLQILFCEIFKIRGFINTVILTYCPDTDTRFLPLEIPDSDYVQHFFQLSVAKMERFFLWKQFLQNDYCIISNSVCLPRLGFIDTSKITSCTILQIQSTLCPPDELSGAFMKYWDVKWGKFLLQKQKILHDAERCHWHGLLILIRWRRRNRASIRWGTMALL